MSIYIREVITIDEDFFYLLGNAFRGRSHFADETLRGVTRSYEIGRIVNNHEPNMDRLDARFSLSVYFR